MKALSRIAMAGVTVWLAMPAAAQPPAAPQVTTVAQYPHGQFLENLDRDGDGALFVTSYVDRRLLRWRGTGTPEAFVTLPAHPVGVLVRGDRIVVSAHGASFTDGPAFLESNRMLVLDRAGKVVRTTALPEARFLNGLAALADDTVLVADSLAGVIWSYRPSTGAVSTWLRAPELSPDPAAADRRPGANGLKLQGGWLYVSNSSRGALYRVRVAAGKPAGPLTPFARTGPIDDFAFLEDGSIAAATHGARLIRIDARGRVSDILADGCDACTAVAALPGGDLIVTTSGNLLEGGDAPARLLKVRLPGR